MRKQKTAIGFLLLISLLCCLFSGCSKNEGPERSDSGAMILNSVDNKESISYKSSSVQFSDSDMFVYAVVPVENEIIVYGEEGNIPTLQDYSLDGNAQITYELSWMAENQFVSAIASESRDSIALVMCTDNDNASDYTLHRIYADGRNSTLADLEPGDNIYINGLYQAGENLYLSYIDYDSNEYTLAKYSDMGVLIERFHIGKAFVTATDGETIYIGTNNNDGLHINILDCESGKLTEICAFDSGRLLAAQNGKIYIGNETDIFCYDTSEKTISPLFQWTSIGVRANGNLCLNTNGQYIVWLSDTIRLVEEKAGNSAQTKEIVMAVNVMPNELSNTIIRFNDGNDQYHLSVEDYSQYADPMQTLAAEMNAGKAPDIIDVLSFSSNIVNGKALEDLVEYFNADPDISTTDLLEGPFNAMMTKDQKLLSIAPAFTIWSVTGGKELVSKGSYSNVSERLDALGDPDLAFAGALSRNTFLELAFCNQKAELYSQDDIASILEYAAKLPEETEYSYGKEPLYLVESYESFASWWLTRQFFGGNAGDMAIAGLPFFDGTGIIVPSCKLAIPKAAENKDGAWEFLKFMLLSEEGTYSSSAYCPILKAEYERLENAGYSAVENGGTINGETIKDTSHITEFHELVEGVSDVYDNDSTIYSVVLSGAGRFFAGQVSSHEAAADIISRLTLYYGERD